MCLLNTQKVSKNAVLLPAFALGNEPSGVLILIGVVPGELLFFCCDQKIGEREEQLRLRPSEKRNLVPNAPAIDSRHPMTGAELVLRDKTGN